jgi:transcriptional regulator with PAS, ATPase and Fis domain
MGVCLSRKRCESHAETAWRQKKRGSDFFFGNFFSKRSKKRVRRKHMEQITLYHHGTPITRHSLSKNSFSIGTHPANDLVLAARGVAERELVVFRSIDGCWRARTVADKIRKPETELGLGTRIAFGSFSIEVDHGEEATHAQQPGESTPLSALSGRKDMNIIGVSTHLKLLRTEIARLGLLTAPVLVTGETGTGKELVAKGLHLCSNRSHGSFVAVNCGGLTASLLEDTFFGHERGAFTGASAARKGVFEQAHNGTLFLDEIGELPLAQQASLLRILDDKTVRRIGGETVRDVDFRLVAATNRDLSKLLKKGEFRLDLYYRIATLRIQTVPLRDRPEDVDSLARYFLVQMAKEMGDRQLSNASIEALRAYSWPGNVRELRNTLYRAAAMSSQQILNVPQFEFPPVPAKLKGRSFKLDQLSNAKIEEILFLHRGNVAAAARELGVPRTSLRDRLKRVPRVSRSTQ